MSNLTNLQRDMSWFQPNDSVILGPQTTFPTSSVNTDGVVYNNVAHIFCETILAVSIPAGVVRCFGVMMSGAFDTNIPYRVKMRGFTAAGAKVSFHVGYVDTVQAAPVVDNVRAIGQGDGINDAMCLTLLDSADPDYGKPLCFFVAFHETTTDQIAGHVSVQRLITQPPEYGTAFS